MSTDRLRAMLSEATPGPWTYGWDGVDGCFFVPELRPGVELMGSPHGLSVFEPADAHLIALAPDAIALLADMGEALESIRTARGNKGGSARNEALTNDLLARLDALCGDDRA